MGSMIFCIVDNIVSLTFLGCIGSGVPFVSMSCFSTKIAGGSGRLV